MNKPTPSVPWKKPLESFVADEDSFVIKVKRTQRNIGICDSKEANSKIYTPSEGVDELNRLAALNTNELDVHGFLYDRCTLDLFREFMSNSYFKSQNMKFTARLIYLIDWFVNSFLKDDEIYKTSYDSLYHKQFNLISRYNDHIDFNRRYAESEEFYKLTAVEHMALIREDLENTRTFKNDIKEYDPKDLTKFVVSYVYSVIEKDYDTNRKVDEGTTPDWVMNFIPSTATLMGKIALQWNEVDDETIFDKDATMLKAFHMIAQFATYPDIDNNSISDIFKDENIKIASMSILSYIHALMSYAIAIYNTFIADQLRHFWFNPDCIVDYIYSIYQHVRIDEVIIRYSFEITRVVTALSGASIKELFIKLEAPMPTNPMPYNTPFPTNQFDPLPSVPPCPPYNQLELGVHCMMASATKNAIPNTPSSQNLDLRVNQLETTVGSLAGEYANLDLKHRLEVLENSVKGLLGNSTSFDVRLETVDKRLTELENKLDAQVATPVNPTRSAEEISKAMDCANAYFDNVVQPILCCPHNGYVKYIYNNGYPRIELYGTDLDSLRKYGEAVDAMKKEMKKNIPNFDIDHDFIVEFDDGVIQICKCNLCHSKFKIDRNQVKFNK